MPSKRIAVFNYGRCRQRGAVLMIMLVILVIGAAVLLVSSLKSSALQTKRDKISAGALAQAKEALIGYATKVQISSSTSANQPRPGDLPCPDVNNDGVADTPCSGNALGRLPWQTLKLPDLRDGSGERLWYAVSANFKNNPRTALLNSDTPGTITVRNADGSVLNDGSTTSGAVAVIIAPGDVLTRVSTPQDRSSAGINAPANYLDVANGEDNASFTDGSATDGFIQGRIKDSNGNITLNDQLIVVTQDNIMQPVQKRVAGEVKNCLIEYASLNHQLYPWAVPLTDLVYYNDNHGTRFGRIPDNLHDTRYDSFSTMYDHWGPNCNTHNINTPATWWLSWREMVFYALAFDYQPDNYPPSNPCGSLNGCLTVNPPAITADKKFVVMVAGKILGTQNRSSSLYKSAASNYLEGGNQTGGNTYTQGAPSATFNDTVVFQ